MHALVLRISSRLSKYPAGAVVVDMQVIPFFSANLMQLASKFRRRRRRLILKVVRLPHSPPPLSPPLPLLLPSFPSDLVNEMNHSKKEDSRHGNVCMRLSAPPSSLPAAATPYLSHGELTSFVTSLGRASKPVGERGGQLLEGRPAMQNCASCFPSWRNFGLSQSISKRSQRHIESGSLHGWAASRLSIFKCA